MKRKVFIAMPCHAGAVMGPTHRSVVSAAVEATAVGWDFHEEQVSGHDHESGRNLLLARFLASDCTDLVWWDDDVSIQPKTFVNFVAHDVDFVCAAYRHKRDDVVAFPGLLAEVGERKMHNSASTNTPLFSTVYWPIGFSRQTRAAVEKIVATPDLKWTTDSVDADLKVPWGCEFLWMGEGAARRRVSEDYVYCRRYIDAGGDVWVDPLPVTGHTGLKTYEGQLAALLADMVERQRLAEQMEAVGKLDLGELDQFAGHAD